MTAAHTAAEYGTAADARTKAVATARAELARHGHTLHELADGSFLVSRWSGVRPCADLAAVRQFLRLLGVPA